MSYTPEQLAAFVGAAAWIPHIATWIHKYFSRPQITLIPDESCEIGYTTLGTVVNIRLAISGSLRDVLFEKFRVELQHESGERRTLHWRGTKETISQIRDATGIRETVEREESGIAVKVRPDALVDRVFRFQDIAFQQEIRVPQEDLSAHLAHLRFQGGDVHNAYRNSDKLETLVSRTRAKFTWRPGKYRASFHCEAIEDKVRLRSENCQFELLPNNIDHLQLNLALLKDQYCWTQFNGEIFPRPPEPVFNWFYPVVGR